VDGKKVTRVMSFIDGKVEKKLSKKGRHRGLPLIILGGE